jgi:hypothetical protein
MSTTQDTNNILQLSFGTLAFFSIIVTLAGLHYHDSLGCVLLRRWRRSRDICWCSEDERNDL